MTDRRALALSAACITAGILAFLIVTYPSWKAAVGSIAPWGAETAPAAPIAAHAKSAGMPTSGPEVPVAALSAPSASVPPAAPSLQDSAPAAVDAPQSPSFDVVRVEPSGESVIAARAAPGAAIVLLDGGTVIARAQADASGQVALLPPTLAPGEHSLMLSVGEPNSPRALSSQSVAVSVSPQQHTAPMVALIQPDQPARVLSEPTADAGTPAAAATTGSKPEAVVSPMTIASIEVEEMGSFYATGKAAPGSHCRVYLNGSFVATVTAGTDGAWSLKIKRGMKPGHYVVRADQLASAAGQVQARAEVPFDYPASADKSASLLRPKTNRPATQAGAATSKASANGTASGASQASAQSSAATSSMPQSSAAPKSVPRSDTQIASASQNLAAQGMLASAATSAPAEALSGNPTAAGQSAIGSTIIAQLLTTKVIRGDTLWRISRKILGHGQRYTQIYAANTTQIRDPRLIYPGQIFVMPQTTP